MFSLIITLMSIVLVVAVALATLYYGGGAYLEGSRSAQASKLISQGQQLMGAADVFHAETGRWPIDPQELVTLNFLSAVPIGQARATYWPAVTALATSYGWGAPAPGYPVYLLDTDVQGDLCRAVNKAALGTDGVLSKAYGNAVTQCYYSGTSGSYRLVVTRLGEFLSLALPAGEAALPAETYPAAGSNPAWKLVPSAAEPEASTVEPPTLVAPTIGALSLPVLVVGSAPYTLTAPTSNSPGAFTYSSSNPAVATISGSAITVVGAGTATITATQAAAGTYSQKSTAADLQVVDYIYTSSTTSGHYASVADAVAQAQASSCNGQLAANWDACSTDAPTLLETLNPNPNLTTYRYQYVERFWNNPVSPSAALAEVTVSRTIPTAPPVAGPLTPTLGTLMLYPLAVGQSLTLLPPSSPSLGAFTFTSSNPAIATVSGNILTSTGAGLITVTASQAAWGGYSAASVSRALPSVNLMYTSNVQAGAWYTQEEPLSLKAAWACEMQKAYGWSSCSTAVPELLTVTTVDRLHKAYGYRTRMAYTGIDPNDGHILSGSSWLYETLTLSPH